MGIPFQSQLNTHLIFFYAADRALYLETHVYAHLVFIMWVALKNKTMEIEC